MPNPHRPKIKDGRLWVQSACTVGLTALIAIALNGALAAPESLGRPIAPTQSPTAVEGPFLSLTGG